MASRVGFSAFCLVLVVLLGLAPPAGANEADAKAKELLSKYRSELKDSRDISDDDGWKAFKRRLTKLRELGALDCPASRKGLLHIARKGKRLDDRVLAAQGLARSIDLEAVKEVVEEIGKDGESLLIQASAEALAETKQAAVESWMKDAVPALRTPGARSIVLRAGRTKALSPDALVKLFDERIESKADAELVFDIVRALGKAGGTEAAKRVQKAAAHHDMRLRLGAADALAGFAASDEGDAAVRKLLADDEPLVRYAMLRGLGEAKVDRFVPPMSERLADPDRRVRKTALDMLKRISGKDFGFDMGAWRRWHETKDDGAKPKPGTVPSYYGVPIWSDRLAFVLDKSGSMGWPFDPQVTTRMAVAQSELKRVLGILPKRTLFNVVSFESKVAAWKKGEVEADEKSVAKAQRWVDKQESKRGAGTNTYGVLEQTFRQNPRIDTLFFLSDGIPEWGDVICREGLLAAVRSWNRFRRITIHTFAITHMSLNPGRYPRWASMGRAEQFMKELAAAGGGRYHFIRKPPK